MTFDPKAIVDGTDQAELPQLIGALETAKAIAWTRLAVPVAPSVEAAVAWITPEAAAELAQVKRGQVYAWARGQRWASRPSKRCLRIDEQAFRRWLQARH